MIAQFEFNKNNPKSFVVELLDNLNYLDNNTNDDADKLIKKILLNNSHIDGFSELTRAHIIFEAICKEIPDGENILKLDSNILCISDSILILALNLH